MPMVDKRNMTEEEIKVTFINPVLEEKGWKSTAGNLRLEKQVEFTDGQVILEGNRPTRGNKKRADYVLYMSQNYRIAVIEAENNRHPVSYGMQQCREYAEKLGAPFAYATNGDAFDEYDYLTGRETEIPLDAFPTPEELEARLERELNGTGETYEIRKKIMRQPYCSAGRITPRYYQQNAINITLDEIAKGNERILLVMATGTGKTYVAFQIVYRLLQSGIKKKVLYLSDRNFLVDQSIQQDFAPLERVIHKVDFAHEDRAKLNSYQVYFALYQQLTGNGSDAEADDDESEENVVGRYRELFSPDYFDLVIVDECHRGSAKENGRWRAVLEYFSSATQIGMTATPKETRDVSNIEYFGKPVYTYSLKEGIEDGFLAPYYVRNEITNISDGWRPVRGQRDVNGNEIKDRIYNNCDYDYNIVIEDRTRAVAEAVTKYLKETDRMAKTIVFCATEDAAERMRIALTNLNSDMCRENPDYVVRITGSDPYGKSKLDYFVSVSEKYPVIATTSKLLSTGADCKMVKLIVIDENISSVTEFKQIIGRGTRLRYDEGKTHFVIMDFRGVTRLFSDPDWDGPVIQDPDFRPGGATNNPDVQRGPVVPPEAKVVVDKTGCQVWVIMETVSVYDTEGRLLRQENIIDYTKRNIRGSFASLEDFINEWTAEEKKEAIREIFDEKGIDLEKLKAEQGMSDVDDYDFICHLAYDQKPLTRKERAEKVKRSDVFSKYGPEAREVLGILLDKYADEGVYEMENTDVLTLDTFRKFGRPTRIVRLFGGKDGYKKALKEIETELYKAA